MPTVNKQVPPGVNAKVVQRQPTTPQPRRAGYDPWGSDRLKLLVYGKSGEGKTIFVGSFPGPVLWLLCSGGKEPGELKSLNTAEHRAKITPHVVDSSYDFRVGLEAAPKFAMTVLDHASGLQDVLLREILGVNELPAQLGWGSATQQQYGQLALQCKEMFRRLLGMPGNVVIIAQERTFGGKDEGGDPDLIRPTVGAALTPSVAGWLGPACDYVVQCFKKSVSENVTIKVAGKEVTTTRRVPNKVEYCLRTGPHDVFMTKFRVPKGQPLPDYIVDPDYDKLMTIINGEYREDT